ncbi:ParB N-terminal domain-containing protein [Kitasatospora sp. NPDC058263]
MTTVVEDAVTGETPPQDQPGAGRWPVLPVAALLSHPANTADAEPDPELTASVAEHGIQDPLHVVHLRDGRPQVLDGLRRLAAAQAAGLEAVPYSPDPQIRVTRLSEHPANARADMALDGEFLASIEAEGVRIKLVVTPDGEGLRVVDGHRRLAAAVRVGETHVPYDLQIRSEADQVVDMLTTANHRRALTEIEQATALFAAAELGADTGRLATASRRTRKAVATAVAVGGSTGAKAAAKAAAKARRQVSLGDLEALTSYEDDPEAVVRLTRAAEAGYLPLQLEREARNKEITAKTAATLAELTAAGCRVRGQEELGEKASPVRQLRTDDGGGITEDEHATCRGAVWVIDQWGDAVQYCHNTGLYGHQLKADQSGGPARRTTAERNAIKGGNLDWDDAETVRRRWLKEFLARGKHSTSTMVAIQRHTALAMLGGAEALGRRISDHRTTPVLAAILGVKGGNSVSVPRDLITKVAAKASGPRLAVLTFAVYVACHEMEMKREAWRTNLLNDGRPYTSPMRPQAARYLAVLASLGYPLTPIEQAVHDLTPYTPDAADPSAPALS